MSTGAPSLLDILDLETLDVDLYRGASPDTERQRVFGGQVAGQALVAAGRTVDEERHVHSLHAYFLRPGDPTEPIIYHADRIRDGGSFTTRRVVAAQRGQPIFHLSASFHRVEDGFEHQRPMPDAPPPDSLASVTVDRLEPGTETGYIAGYSAIDLRPVPDTDAWSRREQAWFRITEHLPDQPLAHVCAAAYASDLTLLGTAVRPHDTSSAKVQGASLDHAMWFHRPFRADEWLLYDRESPSASGARGLAIGYLYTAEGRLVATVVQEGLMRPLPAGR